MIGTSPGKFSPKLSYTREQSIVTILRAYNNANEPPEEEDGTPNWWGEYAGEEYAIRINNFNGTSFRFEIYRLRDEKTVYDGVAALDPDDDYAAMYGELYFYLDGDDCVIDIFTTEGSKWAYLRGRYERID